MKKLFLCLATIAALVVESATYSKMSVDVSALPKERAFFREVMLTRVWNRTPPSDAEGTLTVRLAIDPSFAGENAVVKVADGVAEIRGGRFRSLVFGAGVLLRTIRYGAKTFELEDGEYGFEPTSAIRIAYMARHFDNWYHRAGADEIIRYVEDLALWGINGFHMQLDYAVVDAAKATEGDKAVFAAASVAIGERVHALDMELTTGGGSNCAPSNMPEQFRAVPNKVWGRGAPQFNVCPEKPGALDYLISIRQGALDRAQHIPISGYIYWPFDEGGCACEKCDPWGGRGYVKLIERFRDMNEKSHPGSRHYVSTWLFVEEDWEMFYKYLEKQDWIDAIVVDSHNDFPRYPLEHPVPKNIPVITFPEISMWGRFPWGGTGANPLPARFERLYRQCQKIAKGFELYSEGIYEDVNKIVVNGLYIDPRRTSSDLLKDYASYELPGCDPNDFVALCAKLEDVYETHHEGGFRGWKGFVVANYVREEKPEELERRLAVAHEARALADRIDRSILPSMRQNWRWRQLYLRAQIDEAVYAARDIRPAAAMPAYSELAALYHAERQVTGLYDDTWRGYTCPPFAENVVARKKAAVATTFLMPKPDIDGQYPKIVVDYGGIPGKGHVQGICASPRAIYLGRTHDIVKADWSGRIVKRVEAPNHTGDLCWWNGRIYSSIADRGERAGKGRIQVFDEDLNLLHDVPTAKAMDGITCMGGVLYIGNGVMPWPGMKEAKEPHRTNLTIRYDAVTLEPLSGMEEIDHGQNTCYGIQNLTTDGERLFARFYPAKGCDNTVIYTKDWKPLATFKTGRAHGMECVGPDLFILCETGNWVNSRTTPTGSLSAELTFWKLTETGFVNVTAQKTAKPPVPAAGSRQHDAVAAAYALRTPERTDRFADGWAFANAVYGGLAQEPLAGLTVFSYDRTQDETGLDAAVRTLSGLLEPGDLVVSGGTNVCCFYAGDVYGERRGKLLAVNQEGFVGEWSVGTYPFNWPYVLGKMPAAGPISVLRPLNSEVIKVAERRSFPRGIGERVDDERVRAAVATAWAHYLKNECTQYDSIGLVCDELLKSTHANWSRKNDRLPIEECTPDRTYYSVCSSYAYEVYYGAFGYGIGDDHKGRLSFELTQYPPPGILVYRHEKGKDAKPDAEALKEARAVLLPGDVIAYANVSGEMHRRGGHVLVYIGEVDGIGALLHSVGGKFDFKKHADRIEPEGTVVKNDVDDLLFTKGSPRYLAKFDQFVILRPLQRADLTLTPTGKARATHPKFRYDRRVAGGVFGSVVEGGHLRYSVEVFNAGADPCDATVREAVPEGTELISFSEGATVATNSIVWPILLRSGERRTVEWTVRAKLGTAGGYIVADGGSAGGVPSNRLETQVVSRMVPVSDAFRWADASLTDCGHLPSCRVRGWCGGYGTADPPREGRVRETRSRDLMPGDVVAAWTGGRSKPSVIWVRDELGLVERTPKGMKRVPEEKVSALLAADVFCAFRPAAQ
ncbi:MAG: DUF11 domain-containing protein [Kiritimatiellae bacterium]|nr:DUF11 domain-containing protein [Kiritimatiellia bacterium]